jgi:phosphoribosylformylglycinamidine synthase
MRYALEQMGHQAEFVWHKEDNLNGYDFVALPGGFSYGDYLRSGAIAKFSPIMKAVAEFAESGKPVLGVCNGFQILVEAGLLPGALIRNRDRRFICDFAYLKVENTQTIFTAKCDSYTVLRIPIAHGEGQFVAGEETIAALNENRQVVFRYANKDNVVDDAANPNGSMQNIAGIINKNGNVLGMMPHPERAIEILLGSEDGRKIFESLTS